MHARSIRRIRVGLSYGFASVSASLCGRVAQIMFNRIVADGITTSFMCCIRDGRIRIVGFVAHKCMRGNIKTVTRVRVGRSSSICHML